MSAKLPELTWYRPALRTNYNGATWTTDRRAAIEAEGAGEARELPLGDLIAPCTQDVVPGEEKMGYVVFGDRLIAATYYDLIRQVHGQDLQWKATPARDGLGPVTAYMGARAVAVVMCCRRTETPCKCPWCGGSGFAEQCGECEGTGEVEHECTCGYDHEHVCHDCDGAGGSGECFHCEGTKCYRKGDAAALAESIRAMEHRA